jgi:hypothetical protein
VVLINSASAFDFLRNIMPLAFESENHGTIAFGFFNIESDMLLLEHYFFFAEDFCREVSRLSGRMSGERDYFKWETYDIPDFHSIGDLHGAIAGTHLVGFIGAVYKKYPFPRDPEAFKQNPVGYLTRQVVEDIIVRYGEKGSIRIWVDEGKKMVGIGEYVFSYKGFQALIRYVWQGGYPGWKDAQRPDYVLSMKTAIAENPTGMFDGLQLDE